MSIRSWRSTHIVLVWIGAVVAAAGVVRLGDSLRPTQGEAIGFYIGSLFIWVIWLAWIVTWRWSVYRNEGAHDRRWRLLQAVLIIVGVIWSFGTVFEYL